LLPVAFFSPLWLWPKKVRRRRVVTCPYGVTQIGPEAVKLEQSAAARERWQDRLNHKSVRAARAVFGHPRRCDDAIGNSA
jgi:hypothetical protein